MLSITKLNKQAASASPLLPPVLTVRHPVESKNHNVCMHHRNAFTASLPQISGTMRMMGGSAWLWLTVIVTVSAALLVSYFGVAWSMLFLPTRDVVGQEVSSSQRHR